MLHVLSRGGSGTCIISKHQLRHICLDWRSHSCPDQLSSTCLHFHPYRLTPLTPLLNNKIEVKVEQGWSNRATLSKAIVDLDLWACGVIYGVNGTTPFTVLPCSLRKDLSNSTITSGTPSECLPHGLPGN